MSRRDDPLFQLVIYPLSWWIIKRQLREERRRYIAIGVIGLVIAGGVLLSRPGSSE